MHPFDVRCLQLTRDVPGIDSAHLAMDTEEGVEVVWNEVCYSNRKLMKGTKVRTTRTLFGRSLDADQP